MTEPDVRDFEVLGFKCTLDATLGHLMVRHDGAVTWDQLQAVKNAVWGAETRAIEVYPAVENAVTNEPMRHLWRLTAGEFCPDLLGRHPDKRADWNDTLEARYYAAWAEADLVGIHERGL